MLPAGGNCCLAVTIGGNQTHSKRIQRDVKCVSLLYLLFAQTPVRTSDVLLRAELVPLKVSLVPEVLLISG